VADMAEPCRNSQNLQELAGTHPEEVVCVVGERVRGRRRADEQNTWSWYCKDVLSGKACAAADISNDCNDAGFLELISSLR
jgi:hypothetical protein